MQPSDKNAVNQPIAVLGAGSWGTGLALYLARRKQPVILWTHNAANAARMASEGSNSRYLPTHSFPESLSITDNLATLSAYTDILIAVPSAAFRETITALKPFLKPSARIVWATKGLDAATGQLLHQVAEEVLGKNHDYAILSGPSFAREVAAGLPTAVVIASKNKKYATDLINRFNSSIFRVYLSTDMIGVEICGVVKNVLAIATGIADGMQLGANARAAIITRGLAEMVRLGIAMGGLNETFMGLAGIGDLILTCTDNQSRNRRFGLAIGSGKSASVATKEIGQVVEGQQNTELVVKLAKHLNIEMPISETVLNILQEKISLNEALQSLLSRATRTEN